MKKFEDIIKSFMSALGVLIYVSTVAWLMDNAKSIFGEPSSLFIPVFMLLLFIISATTTGFLVLGRPIYLYFNGFKKKALISLFATLVWLIFFLIGVGIVILLK